MEIGNTERAAAPVWSIFYGWVVTACAFLVLFLTYGAQMAGNGSEFFLDLAHILFQSLEPFRNWDLSSAVL